MNTKIILLSLFFLLLQIVSFAQDTQKEVVVIADIVKFPSSDLKGLTEEDLGYLSVGKKMADSINPNRDALKETRYLQPATKEQGKYIWKFKVSDPLTSVIFRFLPGGTYYTAPGDSIEVSFDGNQYRFSGKGAKKYEVQYQIYKAKNAIKDPVGYFFGRFISADEYIKLSAYYDEQLNTIIPVIEASKLSLNKPEYEQIKAFNVYLIEDKRLRAFSFIPFEKQHIIKKNFKHTMKDVSAIWDSTMYKSWGRWIRSSDFQGVDKGYFIDFHAYELFRDLSFIADERMTNSTSYKKSIYTRIKNYPGYSPLFRERLLIYYLNEEFTREIGAGHWFTQGVLKDYYSMPGFSAYKSWIKSLAAGRDGYRTVDAPLFNLTEESEKKYSFKNIKGKLAVINFWYTGCESCKQIVPYLTKLQQEFKNDTNVVFLHVSVDQDKKLWLKSREDGIYVPKKGLQLYTDGSGENHEMIRDYFVEEYPTIRMIDACGKAIVPQSKLDLVKDKGFALANLIRIKMPFSGDGPYVFIEKGDVKAYMVNGGNLDLAKNVKKLAAATDQYGVALNVGLQKELTVQPSSYTAPSKMLALSDIEGNFTAFRKLLQGNRVIDEKFNWIFGNGHLVFAGDMFDRGEQVTECLWLIYSLEEKAKAAKGHVHFVLGNHEIMNLNGDEKYVKEKYLNNYKLLGKTLAEVYNEKSELGRWLRTKNIVEKIGDKLFCHGGISPHVNRMEITLDGINKKIRSYYSREVEAVKGTDADLKVLFNARKSPFWYRQYYDEDYFSVSNNELIHHASEAQIDSTLQKFDVKHIITGHTIVADTISVHYGGKVFNTDVHHATGKSEALLIEGPNFYRVNTEGKKVLLFTDDKRKVSGK